MATIVDVDGKVYGYDVNGQLFQLDTTTFQRTNIGDGLGLEVDTANGYQFVVRDMAYDPVGERVPVLGDMMLWDDMFGEYGEIYGGCRLYTVDLTTGELTEISTFGDDFYVYAMTVGSKGEVYYYTTFNDEVKQLNLTTNTITTVINLQHHYMYCDIYCDYTLYYDDLTDTLYLLFTSNGSFFKMITIDAALGSVYDHGYVGEVIEEGRSYNGHYFRGLSFIENQHVHSSESAQFDWSKDLTKPEDPTVPNDPTKPAQPGDDPTVDTTEATQPDGSGATDTGDTTQMGLWIGLMTLALSGVTLLFTAHKKWMNI